MVKWFAIALCLVCACAFGALETSVINRFAADHYSGTAIDSPRYEEHYRWSEGTATGQADLLYHASLTVATSSAATLTLNDGSLTDAFGSPASFARIIAFCFVADGAPVAVGGTFDGWGSASLLDSASVLIISPDDAGYPTSASSATITLTNTGTAAATVRVWLLGKSS
jgi:hypothetical protein